MRFFIIIFYFLFNTNIYAANLIKVAIIDTGLKLDYVNKVPLCKEGSKDFTKDGFNDTNGHGTNVTGLIFNGLNYSNYCFIILKAFSDNKVFLNEALEWAYNQNVNIINLSGGGLYPIQREKIITKKILDKGIILVTAAGNESLNLDKNCNYYPACYDKRIYVIGSTDKTANYGKIVIDATYPGGNRTGFGVTLRGTSQAAAQFTNDLLKTIKRLEAK